MNNDRNKVRVWDLPIRIFHWSLLIAVVYAWYSVEIIEDMEQHFWAGYTILTLLLFRIIWGFVGNQYARFRSFIFPLRQILAYVRSMRAKTDGTPNEKDVHLGHNPLGGLSVLAMLLVLLFQASTGLFSNDEYFFGPLSGLVSSSISVELTKLHHLNFNLIKILLAVHIIAILYYRLVKKEKLTSAMFTGNKVVDKKPANTDKSAKAGSNLLLAGFVLLISMAIVYGLANAFLDSLPVADYGF